MRACWNYWINCGEEMNGGGWDSGAMGKNGVRINRDGENGHVNGDEMPKPRKGGAGKTWVMTVEGRMHKSKRQG